MANGYDERAARLKPVAPPPPSPTGYSLENYSPSWRDRLADLMGGAANAISGKPYDEARRDSMTLLGAFPVTGTGIAAEDMARDFRHGDYLGAGLNAAGVVPDLGPGLKAIFLGAASRMADREGLQLAKQMIEGGASREDTLKKTGWFNQHGDWKYEVDDSPAMIGNAAISDLEKTGQSDRSLAGTLWHDELYRAHPDMRSIPTTATMGPGVPSRGRHGGADEEIAFGGPDELSARSVALHEAQHAAQLREGFPRGASASEYARGPMFDPRARGLASDLSKALTGGLTHPVHDVVADARLLDPQQLAGIAQGHGFGSPDEALDFLKAQDIKRTPQDQYRRTAGEVEARNVQARQFMTPDQRRDMPPWQTQDVPDDQQIVRRYDEPGGRDALAEAMGPLPGAPSHVEGPVPAVNAAAEEYARRAGIDLKRQPSYAEVSPRRGRYIAQAYDRMPHDPADPRVAASYQALADETMAQWQAMLDSGAKIDFLKPGMPDPYPGGPRDALADLRANNHLSVFPTEQGFGSVNASAADNPMLAPTGINHGGHDMLVNDAFRAVHDYFGHGMEGANFGARGEENAWQAHKRLFSPDAVPALTTETRGQNSWVNFGPFGDANRANPRDTTYADQKAGLLPSWATKEGGMPMSYRAQQVATLAALASALGLAGSAEQDK